MPSTPVIYRVAARLGTLVAPAIAQLGPKLAAGHRGRRRAQARLTAWGARSRDRSRPLIWFHASSVGEGLQAESVMLELRRLLPDAQYVYTHFSPSAEPLARQASGGRGRLSPLRPARLRGASARRAAPDTARLCQARSLARARHAGGQPRGPGGHGGRHRQPGQRPAQLAGENRAPRGLPGGGLRRRRLRRGCRTAGPARRGADRIQVLGDPRSDSVLHRVGGGGPRTIRCFDSGRRADPGGRVHLAGRRGRAARRIRPGARRASRMPGSSWFPTSPRPLTSRRWKIARAGAGLPARCA